MNRPRNVELMQKRCITKKRNFTEDRPLRRWRLWSGNSWIINIRTPLKCDDLSIESCSTFSEGNAEQLNYYLMTGFSQFASLIWSVFICILRIVTLSNLIVFFFLSVSINNKLQQPQAAHGVLVYAMKNHGADVVSSLKVLIDTAHLICTTFLWWFDNTGMLSNRKLRSAGTKNSMTGSKRWKLTTRNWFKILMKSTSPWDGWDASKHWANGNSLLVTFALFVIVRLFVCFFQLHANFFQWVDN